VVLHRVLRRIHSRYTARQLATLPQYERLVEIYQALRNLLPEDAYEEVNLMHVTTCARARRANLEIAAGSLSSRTTPKGLGDNVSKVSTPQMGPNGESKWKFRLQGLGEPLAEGEEPRVDEEEADLPRQPEGSRGKRRVSERECVIFGLYLPPGLARQPLIPSNANGIIGSRMFSRGLLATPQRTPPFLPHSFCRPGESGEKKSCCPFI